METTHKVGHFDICKAMALANQDIKIAGLENISNLRATKHGDTLITIGFPGNVVAEIGLQNKYIGGLLLIDRDQYYAMRDKLEAALSAPAAPGAKETK